MSPGDRRHGTNISYRRGCRCALCRQANTEYVRRWRQKIGGSLPADSDKHGTVNGYSNWGCRCNPCTIAQYRAVGDYYHRRADELMAAEVSR